MKWMQGEPPRKFTVTPVRIRFVYEGRICEDDFVWSIRENAWVSATEGKNYALHASYSHVVIKEWRR